MMYQAKVDVLHYKYINDVFQILRLSFKNKEKKIPSKTYKCLANLGKSSLFSSCSYFLEIDQ